MLDNRRLLALVTAIAIVGTLGLLAYSVSLGPLELPIGGIDTSHDGLLVMTSGTVTRARTLSDGGVSLTVSDLEASGSIEVYVPASAMPDPLDDNLVPGALVSVTGTVSMYREYPEIRVASPGDLEVLSGPSSTHYGLDSVMQSIQLFEGMEFSTSGQILDMRLVESSGNVTGTFFTIRHQADNQTYYLDCVLYGRDLAALHGEWDRVSVTGTVSYVRNSGSWRMSVEIITPA